MDYSSATDKRVTDCIQHTCNNYIHNLQEMDTWDPYMTFQYKSASRPRTPRNHSPKIAPCQRTLCACMHWWRIWRINVFPTLWSMIQSNCIPTTLHAILDIHIQYHRGNHQCLRLGTRSRCITCTWSWLAARINFMIRRRDFWWLKVSRPKNPQQELFSVHSWMASWIVMTVN